MTDAPQDDASTSSSPAAPAAAASAGAPAGAVSATLAAQSQASAAPPAPPSPPALPSAFAPPLDPAGPASAAAPSRTVGLDRAVETVRLALRAAADRGVAHARISLSPRELGGIEIHLRHTADGLLARVVAEHGGAAQLLQHAGAELRRALEAQGLTLLHLDIGASGEQGGRQAGEQRGFGETGPRRDAGQGAAGDPAASTDPAVASDTTLALPNGVLVDVLA